MQAKSGRYSDTICSNITLRVRRVWARAMSASASLGPPADSMNAFTSCFVRESGNKAMTCTRDSGRERPLRLG